MCRNQSFNVTHIIMCMFRFEIQNMMFNFKISISYKTLNIRGKSCLLIGNFQVKIHSFKNKSKLTRNQ